MLYQYFCPVCNFICQRTFQEIITCPRCETTLELEDPDILEDEYESFEKVERIPRQPKRNDW